MFQGACVAKRIYVGNLPYDTDNQQLGELFGQYGQVIEATVITDRDTGQSKGFGFVQMAGDAEALTAIAQLNGAQFGNRTLRVNEAQPRAERSGGGGGGRSRDGYGSGGYGGGRGGDYGGGDRSWGYQEPGYESSPRGDDSGGRRRRERSW
jgi:cold-inducible RNA-binding protein